MIFASWGSAQPAGSGVVETELTDFVCVNVPDAKELDRRLKDYVILQEMNVTQTQRVQALEAELALYTREAELRGKIDELRKEEIRALKESFDRMKEIADRSLKLAETSKPKASVGNVLLILLTGGIAALLLR